MIRGEAYACFTSCPLYLRTASQLLSEEGSRQREEQQAAQACKEGQDALPDASLNQILQRAGHAAKQPGGRQGASSVNNGQSTAVINQSEPALVERERQQCAMVDIESQVDQFAVESMTTTITKTCFQPATMMDVFSRCANQRVQQLWTHDGKHGISLVQRWAIGQMKSIIWAFSVAFGERTVWDCYNYY